MINVLLKNLSRNKTKKDLFCPTSDNISIINLFSKGRYCRSLYNQLEEPWSAKARFPLEGNESGDLAVVANVENC